MVNPDLNNNEEENKNLDVLVQEEPEKEKPNLKSMFSLEFSPVILSIVSLFFTILNKIIWFATGNSVVCTIFMFISLAVAFVALVISVIPMFKQKKILINLPFFFSLITLMLGLV